MGERKRETGERKKMENEAGKRKQEERKEELRNLNVYLPVSLSSVSGLLLLSLRRRI